ncbi:MAG: triose-phosphate isomerase [Alphaproteobacteria bacterium]
MSEVSRPLIAGNWKMNGQDGDGLALAEALAQRATNPDLPCDLLVCPPAPLIWRVAQILSGTPIAIGGQDCHPEPGGAHTGDVSAAMLRDAGAGFVIVGHSERRTNHGEGDSLVRAKAAAAHGAGLKAIICIGETEAERDGGETLDVLERQLQGSVPEAASAADSVIAYEPVWAIGTGRTPSIDEISEAHAHIRKTLGDGFKGGADILILYGGSVNPANARDILKVNQVGGALVGGASLKADDFWTIGESCR